MAKHTPHHTPQPVAFRPRGRRKSLINFNDPSKQVHILDWRRRAHEFGLEVDEREDTEEGQPFQVEPERLLVEEEPEAFRAQPIPAPDDDFEEEAEEEGEDAAIPGPREDVDLVRVYLQHIGKRKLLKAKDEQAIGLRIENAQRDLVAALGDIPAAVQTLVALADRIRSKGEPAAELILLPEGGELRDENTVPVLKAFARIKRRRCLLDNLRQKLENPRVGARTRNDTEKSIAKARAAISEELAAQPIRPALIDDVVAELRQMDEAFHNLEHVPRAERHDRCRALETRAGLPRASSAAGSCASRPPKRKCATPSAS